MIESISLSNSLHHTLEQRNDAVKIRLADYPNLTLKELISEIENSEHSVVDINETYFSHMVNHHRLTYAFRNTFLNGYAYTNMPIGRVQI
ncbi:hypothetical protein V4M49_11865 (plasmid) [Levilactobacillus brevis]